MPKVDIYVMDGCDECSNLKSDIKQMKRNKELNCDVNYIKFSKKTEKLFDKKNIDIVSGE